MLVRRGHRFVVGTAAVISCAGMTYVFSACVGDDPAVSGGSDPDGASTNDGADPDGGSHTNDAGLATLTLAPLRPRLVRDASVEVDVSLARGGLTGDVAVAVGGLPTGVTVLGGTIPAAASTAKLTFAAAGNAKLGIAPITLVALGASDLPTSLVVAGTPGQTDESFDGDGFAIDTSSATGVYNAVLVQPDGKVVTAGATNTTGTWIVKRYVDGAPDTAFNTNAAAFMPTTGDARGLALDATTGRIVVVGESGTTLRLTIVRLNADGSIDQGFANAGTMLASSVDHPSGSRGSGAFVLSDSSIVVAGRKGTLGMVERYTAAGVRDSGFVHFTSATDAELFAVAPLAGGSILATGTDIAASPDAQLAVRLLSNGTPDATFAGGTRTYASGCRGYAMALASNGDAILVGDDQTAPSLCQTRIAASGNGNLLHSESTNAGSNGQFLAAAPAFFPEGVYAAGHAGGSLDRYAVVERRFGDGGLDPTFGTTGTLRFEDTSGTPDTFRWIIRAATTTPDGQLVVAGSRTGNLPGGFVARIWQ